VVATTTIIIIIIIINIIYIMMIVPVKQTSTFSRRQITVNADFETCRKKKHNGDTRDNVYKMNNYPFIE
jgi:hypothetical protein